MEFRSSFREWTDSQARVYAAAAAEFRAYLAAVRRSRAFHGGMHWKKIKGREYLYQYRDRLGHGRSLGPRDTATEEVFSEFSGARQEARERLKEQRRRLTEQARFCRAALLNRAPLMVAKIWRCLEQQDAGGNFLAIGSAALYAYECAAGVFLEGPASLDLLASAHHRLSLAGSGEISRNELLQLLRQADRSFEPLPGEGCGMINREGFRVQFYKSGDRRPGKPKPVTVPGAGEPLPPEAGNLHSLVAAPKLTQVVIGRDGLPFVMSAPDPRVFALHQLWLSLQEDREEAQRSWDRRQALAVAELVLLHLPQYDFSSSELDMFPRELAGNTADVGDLAIPEI